jgi:hypothetical protein
VKEDKTSSFSNIAGLTYIGFRKGTLNEVFPEIVRTLVREGLVDTVISERVLR